MPKAKTKRPEKEEDPWMVCAICGQKEKASSLEKPEAVCPRCHAPRNQFVPENKSTAQ